MTTDKKLESSNVKEEVIQKYPSISDEVYECLLKGEAEGWSLDQIVKCVENVVKQKMPTADISTIVDRAQIKQWISIG